jgi:FSR family fosmidomycin resistance protein-like MFS transporter
MNDTRKTVFGVLYCICACHAINDMLQSLLVAVYPILKAEFGLTFSQIGMVTFAYQLTASLLQPVVGLYADRRPTPFSLPAGTLFTVAGLLILSAARSYPVLVLGACTLGVGSSVFHPEASRVARMAAGGRPGLAQSLFQVGGNVGGALGFVGAAVVVLRWGRRAMGGFSALALVSTAILAGVGLWAKRYGIGRLASLRSDHRVSATSNPLSAPSVRRSMAVLLALLFSKFVYLASIVSFYTFYLMHRFGISVRSAQMHLFVFAAAVAAGTLAGGPLGDRIGRKQVIWFSILGALPFTLALPHAGLFWTGVLSVFVGFILASAFPAIVVYGQELIPGRVGMVSGLFFGLSFGVAGSGAALLGAIADATSIDYVYRLCSFLPALGLLAAFLPELRGRAVATEPEEPEYADALAPPSGP